ncbi:MAG: DNA primase [Desulfobacteraceae bacterium]|nr:DNA primase [Desulfobacteraceae bacterium]
MNKITDIRDKVEERLENKPGKKNDDGGDNIIESDFINKCLSRNELGDGELFKKLFRKDFVFNKAMDCWFSWSGHHWQLDTMDHALASVESVASVYQDEAKKLSKEINQLDDDSKIASLTVKRKTLNKRASTLRSGARRKKCIDFAHTSKDALAIDGQDIDQKPYLLPCKNGVINLKTGELEPGRQTDYLLKSSPVSWKGIEAVCPVWEKTLLEIFSDNQNLVDFLQRLLGYSLIGKVHESILVVMTGRGRNGKSMIVETCSKIMGQLSGAIRSEMLLDQYRPSSSSGPSPDIMALRGLRLAFASETDENCKLSTSKVKWLTGNDEIVARSPHDKYDQYFLPSHTLFLLTNNKPHAPADDFAFWERVHLLPFEVSFVNREPVEEFERKADTRLALKLEKELSGILAWMVRGCLDWQEKGLRPPEASKEATNDYQKGEDSIGDFIDDCCLVRSDLTVSAAAVYEVFEVWWKENVSNFIPKKKRFGQLFGKKFERVKKGTVWYLGVALLDKSDNSDNHPKL